MELTETMTLFPDGFYHGLTGAGKEIIVSMAMMESYLEGLKNDETYPGQAWFWAHDPEQWVGGIPFGHARYAQNDNEE